MRISDWSSDVCSSDLVAFLASICWLDDIRTVGPALRFAVQICAVIIGLSFLPINGYVFSAYLPWYVDRVLTGVCWIWFINLYNFMDGIDGLAATESIAICIGVGLIAACLIGDGVLAAEAAIIAGAALGFLWWNWAPARVFLGDVGKIGSASCRERVW